MNSLWTKEEMVILVKANRKIEGLGPEVKKNEESFIQLRNTLALNALHACGYKERKPEEIHLFFTHRFPKIIVKAKGRKPFRGSKKQISHFVKIEDMMRKIYDMQKRLLKSNEDVIKSNKENAQMIKTALLMK